MVPALVALALATAPPPATTPEVTVSAFVDAFRAMDSARFDAFFAPNVTMFFPEGGFPTGRVDGREAVLSAFHSFFARVRDRGRSALSIAPLDLRIEQYGEVAVVTFRLDGGEDVGRRSVILRKIGSDWRIVHFHASTIGQ